MELVSLTDMPAVQQSVYRENQKRPGFSCFATGTITYRAEIPQSGFYCGEEIPIKVNVENGSRRQVRILAELIQSFTYIATGGQRMQVKVIATQESAPLQPHTTNTWNFIVPQMPPAITRSNIIKSFYAVKIILKVPWALDSTILVPISIGNANILQQQPVSAVY